MAPPEYRLQLVLEQRERVKKEKEEAVLQARKALKQEEAKLEQIKEERRQVDVRKAKATDDFQNNMMKPGINIAEEADRHDWYQKAQDQEAVRLDEEVEKQKQAVRRAEQRVEDAKLEVQKAEIDVQALVKHKDKWAKQVKREEAEKEQAVLEELGEVMWLQQLRDEEMRQRSKQQQEP